LIRDPLVFVFLPETISADTEEIKLFLSYSGYIKDNKFVIKNDTEIIPVNVNIQTLSKIISVMEKSIKVIFVKI